MTNKQNTIRTSTLLTALCLSAALTITSCGKKSTDTATTSASTSPEATTPATGASTAPTTTTPAASTGGALSVADQAKLTPVKAALTMANSAVKSGDMAKAKTQFEKFSGMWTTVEPMVKAKAGASYPAIESGINMVKTAMGSATPDKAKAGEGLKAALDGINALMSKK
jgi:iron uptake system EfeUOB component EfeO/EfeM